MSLPCTGKRNLGGADDGLVADRRQIVAVEIDIEDADRNGALLQRLDLPGQPLRQRNAAAADADERQCVQVPALFQNLVRQTDQRTVDLARAHELRFQAGGCHAEAISVTQALRQ